MIGIGTFNSHLFFMLKGVAINMQDLIDKARSYTDVFVFGCGDIGNLIYDDLLSTKISAIIRFCDNNLKSHKGNAEVLLPEEAFQRYPNTLFVIGSTLYHDQMLSQLIAIGVELDNIYITKNANRLIKRPFLDRIEYDLADHCNLNCAGCVHFSNIANERFADLNEFKTNMGRFVKLMGNALKGILLLGGEPLLHPLIEQFIISARELLPNGNIGIATNGTLLSKATEYFWKTCADRNIKIIMSLYPVGLDRARISKLADKYNVRIEEKESREIGWRKFILDLNGKQDALDSFSHCGLDCAQLKNGKLYPCGITTSIHYFNTTFNQCLELKQEDGLDIYSDILSNDVLDFLAKPIPFCRYCKTTIHRNLPWSLSKHVIDEYLEK